MQWSCAESDGSANAMLELTWGGARASSQNQILARVFDVKRETRARKGTTFKWRAIFATVLGKAREVKIWPSVPVSHEFAFHVSRLQFVRHVLELQGRA